MISHAAKTDGSFIEDRESMIIWNFKDSDPEFGTWQSKELRNHIETFFSEQQIQVISCKKSIQVVNSKLQKVSADIKVTSALENAAEANDEASERQEAD